MAIDTSSFTDIFRKSLERWDEKQTATEVRRRQEMAMQEMQARYGLRTGRERDEYYRKNSPYYTPSMAALDEKFEREAKADAKRQQYEFMQTVASITPPVMTVNIGDAFTSITGVSDLLRNTDSPAPNPRAELEQRCKDKGLDPSFARELDLD